MIPYINIAPAEIEKTPHYKIHKLVLNHFRELVPKQKKYYLSSFSLKKGSNIYGLIFGSGHPLGIEKFIDTCWKIDPERGEANYDIDEENISQSQFNLFTNELSRPNRLMSFEHALESKILSQEITSDKDIYLFRILYGFKEAHVKKVINKLIASNKLEGCKLNLTSKICRADAQLTFLKLI
ncbi:MAG: hypothetical protein H7296_07375 [Bacteroidia bacterium]|nr:hypothetical protein [Bacteroidia bacterium]